MGDLWETLQSVSGEPVGGGVGPDAGVGGHLEAKEAPAHRGRPDQAPLREGVDVRAGRSRGDYLVLPPHFTDGKSEGVCLALSLPGG